jgi:hypothetical protein
MSNDRQSTYSVFTDTTGGCFFCCFFCLLVVFSLIFISSGLSNILSGVSSSLRGIKIIECHRINLSRIDCQIKKETLLGKKNIQTIQELKRAEIRTHRYQSGVKIKSYSYHYQITLVSLNSPSYVFDSTTSILPDKTIYADSIAQISNFIENPNQKVLRLQTNNGSFITIIFGIFLTIIGCAPWIILTIAYRCYVNRIVRQLRQR